MVSFIHQARIEYQHQSLGNEGSNSVTVKMAAQRLEVSPATIYSLIAAGKLRCVRIGMGRGAIRIMEEHVAEFLQGAATRSAQPAMPEPPRRHIDLKHLHRA